MKKWLIPYILFFGSLIVTTPILVSCSSNNEKLIIIKYQIMREGIEYWVNEVKQETFNGTFIDFEKMIKEKYPNCKIEQK